MAGLAAARMSGGSEFHAADPACEKARSPVMSSFYANLLTDRQTPVITSLVEVINR